jgi:hypothetical protein
MALSANQEVIEQDGQILSFPVAVAHIYKGAMVKINAAGYLAPAAPEAGSQFAGVAYEEKDNSGGSAGDLECRVVQHGCHVLIGSGLAQTDVGLQVYATDDGVITTTEGTTSKQKVGHIVKVLSATEALVKIEPFSGIGASA